MKQSFWLELLEETWILGQDCALELQKEANELLAIFAASQVTAQYLTMLRCENDLMSKSSFNGLTVAAFESRMAAEITRLIERHGGNPLVAPALREIPLEDNPAALKFGVKLTTERVDILFFYRRWHNHAVRPPKYALSLVVDRGSPQTDGHRCPRTQAGRSPQGSRPHTDADRARTEHLGRGGLHARRIPSRQGAPRRRAGVWHIQSGSLGGPETTWCRGLSRAHLSLGAPGETQAR